MNLSSIIGIVVFLGSYILSQRISLNAAAKLDDATKLRLAEIFPKRNANYTAIVFALIVVFLFATYQFPQYYSLLTICYAIVFAMYFLVKFILNIRTLNEVSAPADYIHSVMVSFAVFVGGAIAAGTVMSVGIP